MRYASMSNLLDWFRSPFEALEAVGLDCVLYALRVELVIFLLSCAVPVFFRSRFASEAVPHQGKAADAAPVHEDSTFRKACPLEVRCDSDAALPALPAQAAPLVDSPFGSTGVPCFAVERGPPLVEEPQDRRQRSPVAKRHKLGFVSIDSDGELSPVSTASTMAPAVSCVSSSSARYAVLAEALGGGMKGIVQPGICVDTQRAVAVKSIETDEACPIRFVELTTPAAPSGQSQVLHLEAFAPASCRRPRSWRGELAYDASNRHAAEPFAPGSLVGRIALVWRGGGVTFEDKVVNVSRGGAAGVLFINTADKLEAFDVDSLSPPCAMLCLSDGEAAADALAAGASGQCLAQVRTDVEHELAICRQIPPHPHVVEVLDAWAEECGAGKLVMERCAGGSSPSKAPDVCTALLLIRHMLRGVAHLHSLGICHRDVKPGNLLLTKSLADPDCRLVLADFSMASWSRRMSVPCGSVRYVAPEVLVSGKYGRERDIWSIGVVAFELLCGRHPSGVGHGNDSEVVRWIESPKPVEVPDFVAVPWCSALAVATSNSPTRERQTMSEELADLLRRLLQRDPRDRLTAEEALSHPCLAERDEH